MTRFKKILKKFHENPCGTNYSDIEKILLAFGCIKISAKGSHIKFKHRLSPFDLIIPVHNNDCKEFYKKAALKFIQNNRLHENND